VGLTKKLTDVEVAYEKLRSSSSSNLGGVSDLRGELSSLRESVIEERSAFDGNIKELKKMLGERGTEIGKEVDREGIRKYLYIFRDILLTPKFCNSSESCNKH
jgi:hypothetical protein